MAKKCLVYSRHQSADMIFTVHDPYDREEWMKGDEETKRFDQVGLKFKYGSKKVFWKAADKLPIKRDFINKKKKIRLEQFLRPEFQRLVLVHDAKIFYSKTFVRMYRPEKRKQFSSGISQKLIKSCSVSARCYRETGFKKAIECDATDIIMQPASCDHETEGLLEVLRKNVVYDCKQLCSPAVLLSHCTI